MQARLRLLNGSIACLPLRVEETGSVMTVVLAKELLVGEPLAAIDFMPDFMTADSGDEGYFVYPTGMKTGTLLSRFKQRPDTAFVTGIVDLPVFGMKRGSQSILAIVSGMATDFQIVVGVKDGRYTIYPRFLLEGDPPYADIVVAYHRLADADYSAMARCYRQVQLDRGACVPLRQRAIERPLLGEAVASIEVRIRLGWKPAPSPIRHQRPDLQPPMHVACSFARAGALLDEMHRQGVERAEICLVGWNSKGHDGCFPQHFPVEAELGGEQGMRDLIAKARSYGYLIVCFSNSTGAYECAETWSEAIICKERDGSLGTRHAQTMPLSGGQPYLLCPQPAYEQFAVHDLPRMRDLGLCGLHYIDVLTATAARTCHDPQHPVNRRQCVDWYKRIGQLSIDLFGGFQSEGPYDFLSSVTDFVLYTSFNLFYETSANHFAGYASIPICDAIIPFYQLVYHGIILSNPGAETINAALKDKATQLKLIEYGGRPLFYYYAKFIDEDDRRATFGNWMGRTDLVCTTDTQLKESVALLKQTSDEYARLSDLQYAFMDQHEQLAAGVYRVTYSDGTVVTVDYNQESYEVTRP